LFFLDIVLLLELLDDGTQTIEAGCRSFLECVTLNLREDVSSVATYLAVSLNCCVCILWVVSS